MSKARSNYNTTYPLKDVMAHSVMAYHINNNEYRPTGNYESDNPGRLIPNYANKDLVKHSIVEELRPNLSRDSDGKLIPNYAYDNVPDEVHYEIADEIISYYQGLMFKAIGGKVNDFESKVLLAVKEDKVAVRDFGIIASLPKSHSLAVQRDLVEQKQVELSDSSNFIGCVGDTTEITIEIMRINFIQNLNCHVVNARSGDNLVVFFTSKYKDFENFTTGAIRGRVKRHQTSNYHNGKETVLNYVKVM